MVSQFNPSKTESPIISRKLNKPNVPILQMNNQPIKEVTSHKHLDIFFLINNYCTWHSHIDHITSKAWKGINIMLK